MNKYRSIYQTIKQSAIIIIMLAIITGCSQGPQLENGNKYLEDEEYKKAISVFEKALENETEKYEAEIGLAKAYMCLEEYEKAEKSMRNALDIDSSDKETWKILILLGKAMKKDIDEMTALYNEAFEKTGNYQFESGLEEYLDYMDKLNN